MERRPKAAAVGSAGNAAAGGLRGCEAERLRRRRCAKTIQCLRGDTARC